MPFPFAPRRYPGVDLATRRMPSSGLSIVAVVALTMVMLAAGVFLVRPTSASAATHTIVIKNFTFSPDTLNVSSGDTITWVNQETDGTVHNIRGAFTSPDLRPGQSYSTTVSGSGTLDFHCGVHPYMTGTVNVGGGGSSPPPSPTPTPTPTGDPTTDPSPTPTPTGEPTSTPTGSPTTSPTSPEVGKDQGDGTYLAKYDTVDGVKVFRLRMAPVQWTVSPGVVKTAWAFNGVVPGPTIRVNEGDKLKFIVENDLPEHTAVHWHGQILPNSQDGVPGVTQPHIQPGETYTYEFTAKATGTHWYHSHMGGGQVGKGLFGSFEVTPRLGDISADRHYTQMIGDGELGFTFNGRSYPATIPLRARVGEKVHIRLIGTGPEQIHPIHLHGMPFQVVAQDGNRLASPYTVDTLSVAPGQTFDIVFTPTEVGHWLLHCHIFSHSESAHGMTGLVTTIEVDPAALSLPSLG